jgi:polysaccharide export outer membrane protein
MRSASGGHVYATHEFAVLSWRPVLALTAVFAVWTLSGCGGKAARGTAAGVPPGGEPGILELTNPAVPVPPERFLKPEPALIAPGEQLEIRVLNYPEISGNFFVAPDGRINLNLIGSVEAAGKSAEQLDRDLTTAYSSYIRNLDLAVSVILHVPRYVYVLGVVIHGARYEFSTGDRVLHSLAMAGGMTEKARENGVVLFRRDTDGKDHAYKLDFSHVYAQIAPQDVYLQPGDVILVPKSRIRTATDFGNAILETLNRASTTALLVEDISSLRNRAVTISR